MGDVPFHATSLGMTTAWVRGIRDDGRARESRRAGGRRRVDRNSRRSSVMRMMEMWSAAVGGLWRGRSGQRMGVMPWPQVMQWAGRGLDDSGSAREEGARSAGEGSVQTHHAMGRLEISMATTGIAWFRGRVGQRWDEVCSRFVGVCSAASGARRLPFLAKR